MTLGLHRIDPDHDRTAIEAVVASFFSAFTSGPDCSARLDALRDLFLPAAIVVSTGGAEPTVHDVDRFIQPRRTLLESGAMTDFREWPVDGHVQLFGDVAHWFGSYAKSWSRDGTAMSGRGMKTIQLVRTSSGWRISAAAWDDERDGLAIDDTAAAS